MKTTFPLLNFGLYRDDGLAVHRRLPGPQLDATRKKLHRFFNEFGLIINVCPDLETVNFLDVTLDLKNGNFGPYRKPNDVPLYIHRHSNHPPNIIKEVPKIIEGRLNSIASSELEFKRAVPEFQEALKKSGFHEILQFTPAKSKTIVIPNQEEKKEKEGHCLV